LEGAAWDRQAGQLVESQPKTLFVPSPIIYVTGNTRKEEEKTLKEMFGVTGPYKCPVYKYAMRTDRYFIFFVNSIAFTSSFIPRICDIPPT
jgi:dynein heavy chain